MFCLNHVKHYDENCLECLKEQAYEPFLHRYDFNNFDESQFIGKFVRSNIDTPIYHEPGGTPWRVAKTQTYIGKGKGFNSKKNWLQLEDGDWVYFNDGKNFIFNVADPNVKPLTTKEKIDIAAKSIATTSGTGKAGELLIKGGGDAAVTVSDILPDFSTIKWVLIGILVLVVLTMIYKMIK